MKELFKTLIKDFQNSLPRDDVKDRHLKVPLDSGKVISLSGPRRSGKTFYAFQLINQLVSQGLREKIIYINFEDERLTIDSNQLQLILDAYYELYPHLVGKELYLFLDEIQEITGWEKFVRRLYDTVTKHVFITGSSAKMLGKEIATSLRGRNLVYNVFPLSFGEYCTFQNVDVTDHHSTRAKAILRTQFQEYLMSGGYPETVFLEEEIAQKTLQSYFDVMMFRDIIERYRVSSPLVLKQFLKRALNNIAQSFSVHKFYNELKSQGLTISKNTVYEFLDQSVDCFLLFVLNPYDPSVARQQMKSKKLYAIDTGLVNAITYRFSEDTGKLLENIIFLHLIQRNPDVFFLKNNFECDFVVETQDRIHQVIQVSLTLQEETTRNREVKGLLQAMKRFDLSEGVILTLDEEEQLVEQGKTIFIQPVWKWLLAT